MEYLPRHDKCLRALLEPPAFISYHLRISREAIV